ncbi:DUF899 family protein [Rhizobium nepotum]|uniref:DUF899 family protein n=1 Tax=Rhizobium nepotum TaxID=1035271 RepID=UPI003369C2F7
MITSYENGRGSEFLDMQTPPITSAEAWKVAWEELDEKEKAHLRVRDVFAAERRRLPWLSCGESARTGGVAGRVRGATGSSRGRGTQRLSGSAPRAAGRNPLSEFEIGYLTYYAEAIATYRKREPNPAGSCRRPRDFGRD